MVRELEGHEICVSDHVSRLCVFVPPLTVPSLPSVGLPQLDGQQAPASLSKPPHLGVESSVRIRRVACCVGLQGSIGQLPGRCRVRFQHVRSSKTRGCEVGLIACEFLGPIGVVLFEEWHLPHRDGLGDPDPALEPSGSGCRCRGVGDVSCGLEQSLCWGRGRNRLLNLEVYQLLGTNPVE